MVLLQKSYGLDKTLLIVFLTILHTIKKTNHVCLDQNVQKKSKKTWFFLPNFFFQKILSSRKFLSIENFLFIFGQCSQQKLPMTPGVSRDAFSIYVFFKLRKSRISLKWYTSSNVSEKNPKSGKKIVVFKIGAEMFVCIAFFTRKHLTVFKIKGTLVTRVKILEAKVCCNLH